jgi:hypothetical protein
MHRFPAPLRPLLRRAPRRRTWATEAPLLLGILGGLLALWLRGRAFVLDRDLRGNHWPEYLVQAWRIDQGSFDTAAGFRKPLYPALLQALGEHLSYADAAVLLGSASAAVCVVAAGVLARALADAPAGGLAAFGVGLVPLVAHSSHWATAYPFSAATIGAGLACAAVFARWPWASTAALPALGAGLALAADDRGALVVPMAGLCAVLGTLKGRGAARLALPLLPLALLAPAAVEQALGYVPELFDGAEARLQTRLDAQRAVAARWAAVSPRTALASACTALPIQDWLQPAFLGTDCARAVVADNRRHVLPGGLSVPLSWAVVGGLAWLSGRHRRESPVVALLLLGALVGPLLLLAAATPLPARYLLQLTVPLGVLLPVGVARLAARLPPPLGALAAVGTLAAVWTVRPSMEVGSNWAASGQWSPDAWVGDHDDLRAAVAPGQPVLDCSDHAAAVALLPDHTLPDTDLLEIDIAQCRRWARGRAAVPQGAWLLTDPLRDLGVPGQHARVPIHALVDAAHWIPRVQRRGFVAWQWRGGSGAPASPPAEP